MSPESGYRVTVTPATAVALVSATEQQATLHVHTHVREDAIVLYGFVARRRATVLRGAPVVPRRGSRSGVGHHGGALAGGPLHGRARRRSRHLVHRARGRPQDGGAAADRAQEPRSTCRTSRSSAPARPSWRVTTPGERGRRGPRRGPRCPSSATHPTRSAARSTAYATMSEWRSCCVWPCASWLPGECRGAAARCWPIEPDGDGDGSSAARVVDPRGVRPRSRSSRRSAFARARWTNSSGSPSWSSTWASSCRRPGSDDRRSTISSLPDRRGWARPRWPGSWPPRWAWGSESPRARC